MYIVIPKATTKIKTVQRHILKSTTDTGMNSKYSNKSKEDKKPKTKVWKTKKVNKKLRQQ